MLLNRCFRNFSSIEYLFLNRSENQKPKIKTSTKLWWRRINLYNYDLAILLFFFFSKIRKIFKRSWLSRKLSDAKKSAKIKESLEERNGRRETIARLKSAEEEEGVITEWPCSLVTVSVFQADIFTVISTSGWSEEPVFRFFFVELPRKIYRYIYIYTRHVCFSLEKFKSSSLLKRQVMRNLTTLKSDRIKMEFTITTCE